jgi:hypothetical protein
MRSSNTDVSPTIEAMIIDHWRTTPTWKKLASIDELNATLQTLALSDLRRRHPTESEAQLTRRLATRWLGAELADRV